MDQIFVITTAILIWQVDHFFVIIEWIFGSLLR